MSDIRQASSIWINYFYFGLLFFLLIFLSASSVLCREDLGGSQLFFLLYSVGEATLEVVLFIFFGWLIQRFLSPIWFVLYTGFTFFCLFLHVLDFLLDRFLHFTLWETIDFIFDESFQNFFQLLDASGVPMWVWGVGFAFILFIPFLGMLLYFFTSWLATKHPFGISLEMIVQAIFLLPVALFLWDYSTSRMVLGEAHHAFIKSLPWKTTFLQPKSSILAFPHCLSPPSSEEEIQKQIAAFPSSSRPLPNIYLFVVESLRDDFICPEITPALSAFRDRTLHSELGLSNANASQISWFSIFHSNFPYYWKILRDQGWKSGSPALQLLRKLGYQIRVYSAANLSYYGMDQFLFGEEKHLANSFQHFPHPTPKETWKSDSETLEAFEKDFAHPENQQGQCVIFFWDSTHFDYSWPKEEATRFAPVAKEMNYFQAYLSKKKIESIKNRYRNAVHFIDRLFERFLSLLPNQKEAVICFTGDHGEEFFEHGHLFHLSQLCDVQTQVPIYFQLPRAPEKMPPFLSHMDLFPTIIDAVTFDGATKSFLEGQSIFLKKRWPFAILARYNASRTPYEICLHNGTHKLIARFANPKDVFRSPFLHILSLRTASDQMLGSYKPDLNGWIHREFDGAFERLFRGKHAKQGRD